MEISSLKDSYCSLDDILSSFGNEFSDNAGDSIVDTDYDRSELNKIQARSKVDRPKSFKKNSARPNFGERLNFHINRKAPC